MTKNILEEQSSKNKGSSYEALSKRFGLLFLPSLLTEPFVQEKIQKLPYRFAKQKKIIVVREEGGVLWLALSDPLNLQAIDEAKALLGGKIAEVLSSEEAIDSAIEHCYQSGDEETTRLIAELGQDKQQTKKDDSNEVYDLLEPREDSPVIRIVNAILLEAIKQGASDIHFEPHETGLSVRYRIDGVLQSRHAPSKEVQPQIITRIKVMSQLDIAESRLPQDGRIKLRVGGRTIDFRVSTVPVVYGERIVLRILDKSNIVLGLVNIGMPSHILKQFQTFINMPEGIVLVTGPTGSGKTTTLYSALSELNTASVNIMTIEDPVEYKLAGMAQIGVNPKIHLNFAAGLRHILRQDPDVIMIGEIRDKETAEIAIQSSLTGHLVLSTLHTNDAPSALTRLVDMGIEPYLLSSSIIGILAQRLVRTICSKCKTSYTPSDRELIDLGLNDFVGGSLQFYKGDGCEHCFDSGYKGRCGIYELMGMSQGVKRQLLKSVDASEIKKVALEEGFKDLRKEGVELVIKGVTTSSEVMRVTKNFIES